MHDRMSREHRAAGNQYTELRSVRSNCGVGCEQRGPMISCTGKPAHDCMSQEH